VEREKAHAERRCGCSASILTERAPSSRTWDYPAAANLSPRPAPLTRRGSPGTKVADGAGQRARGVGTRPPGRRSFGPALWEFLVDLHALGMYWGVLLLLAVLEGRSHFRLKKKKKNPNVTDSRNWL
jgi:hypothetical protein